MDQVNETQVLEALKCVVDPERSKDIVSLGMVQGLQIKDGHVALALEVDPRRGPHLEPLRKQVETLVHKLPGVITATVVLTAERQNAAPPPPQRPPHRHPHPTAAGADLLAGVGAIVAVASGKGGVGK